MIALEIAESKLQTSDFRISNFRLQKIQSPKSEVRNPKSEVRSPKSEVPPLVAPILTNDYYYYHYSYYYYYYYG